MSSANACGSSIAAKCPPRRIKLQRWTFAHRASHERGGLGTMSFGKDA